MDVFDQFGLSPAFGIDEADLHRRFLSATSENHPDRFDDPIEQADAAERSAHINEAYKTLKDPERRANALIVRLGGPAKEDDKSLPPDLLMQMMEVREQHDEAVSSKDIERLRQLAEWAAAQRRQHLDAVTKLFYSAQKAPADDRHPILKQIRLQLNALRYVQRMIDQTAS